MPQRTTLSHADMVAAATKDNGPLSIGGWVPPTTFAGPAARGAAALQPNVEVAQDDIDGGDDDGLERREANSDANEAEEAREKGSSEPPQEAGGLVGYGSSSDSDSGSDAPAERDRPVSFF